MTSSRDNFDGARRVVVIGGGPAGMMAAISAAECLADVTLVERNERLGKKLNITGKGRCNVTNACGVQDFMSNVPTNPRFLYSSLGRFSTEDTMSFFESAGVKLKVERGQRVFPESDRASDITEALKAKMRELGVKTLRHRIDKIDTEDGTVIGVSAGEEFIPADAVILATGGMSYPLTGSDGDGYRLAREHGHTVVTPEPSLVPLVSRSRICPSLQGLSLKNVSLTVTDRQSAKVVYEDFGEMMFTHFGLTGPMILSASAHLRDIKEGRYEAHVNLKPALDRKTLDARILSDFAKYSNKDFINALDDLLPKKLIPVIVSLSGIDSRKKVNSVTKEEREALIDAITDLKIRIDGTRPIAEAIITKGGISVKEINPASMASRLCEGLYFAGEVIDVDAYTGGFNLQIAFSTGHLAGESAAYGV